LSLPEDLAEAALSRQVDFEAQAKKLDAVQSQARDEEQRLEDGLSALKARKAQMEELDEVLDFASGAVESMIADGVEKAMTRFNRRARGVTQEEK